MAPMHHDECVARLSVRRVQIRIKATRHIRLNPFQGAQVHGLVSAAMRAAGRREAVPDGLLLDLPERSRIEVRPTERFAFGFTLLGYSDSEAADLLGILQRGLARIGESAGKKGVALGGNFRVSGFYDLLVPGTDSDERPFTHPLRGRAVPRELTQAEVDTARLRLGRRRRLELDFFGPLVTKRPSRHRTAAHKHFDHNFFDAALFLRRLLLRLEQLGYQHPALPELLKRAKKARAGPSTLAWVEASYKKGRERRTIGGAAGRIELSVNEPELVEALLWGQYARVGSSTRFGFGAYEVLGANTPGVRCPRAVSLLKVVAGLEENAGALDDQAERESLESGVLRHAWSRLFDGSYAPRPYRRLLVPKEGGAPRVLAIPHPIDSALQRLVLGRLAPTIDAWLEQTSFAYRKGLNIDSAARHVGRAVDDGFCYALKADFRRLFDSIDHGRLEARLSATLGDRALVELLMDWVRAGAPQEGRGLPTGAPISPVLANLFLDQFDEEIAASGARLVRYADDFIILYKEKRQADEVFKHAQAAARELALFLNARKTRFLEPGLSFTFLGFEFRWHGEWTANAVGEPIPLAKLGWHFAGGSAAPKLHTSLRLPGETGRLERSLSVIAVPGPGLQTVRRRDSELIFEYEGRQPDGTVKLEQLRELVLTGPATLERRALDALLEEEIPLLIIGSGRDELAFLAPGGAPLPAPLVLAQSRAASQSHRALGIARKLVAAKLHNHAVLASSLKELSRRGPSRDLASQLHDLAERAASEEFHTRNGALPIEQLLGLEGRGARLWYGSLNRFLPRRFTLARRQKPAARDPVNALLNFGHTLLYRQAQLALRRVGLVDSVGFLHRPHPGHAALASDVMEPFRHLIERLVLRILRQLDPRDFDLPDSSREPIWIKSRARRQFTRSFFRDMAREISVGEDEPRSYRARLDEQVRSLKQSILHPERPFNAFVQQLPVR